MIRTPAGRSAAREFPVVFINIRRQESMVGRTLKDRHMASISERQSPFSTDVRVWDGSDVPSLADGKHVPRVLAKGYPVPGAWV